MYKGYVLINPIPSTDPEQSSHTDQEVMKHFTDVLQDVFHLPTCSAHLIMLIAV